MTFASVARVWPIAAPLAFAGPLFGGQHDQTLSPVVVGAGSGDSIFPRSASDREVSSRNVTTGASTLPSRLREARIAANEHLLRVSARMSPDWRKNMSWQLNALLDPDEWDGDEVLDLESWKSFIRGLFVLRPLTLPGLGLSPQGNIVASWSRDGEHVDIEFKPGDEARWILATHIDGEVERASGRGPIIRLGEVIEPYGPRTWFAT